MPHSPFHHRRTHAKKDAGNPKYVVAHHMVGNTYPYTVNDWLSDINQAHAAGIDAFALNIGSDSWQPTQVGNAYTAAQQSGTGFKLFISFDMSVLPCDSPDAAGALRNYISTYASHPNQLKYNGRSFASTFSGETCTFGQDNVQDGWRTQFTAHPDVTAAGGVHFVPAFFIDPATFGQYSGAANGMFNWNSGWPIELTTQTAQNDLNPLGASLTSLASQTVSTVVSALAKFVGATDTDSQYVNGLKSLNSDDGSPTYMGAVSPWFFTHYGADTYNKNWIYYAGSHLYPTRWDSIFQNRDMYDLVEICTWNDFGESHYIGPIHGAQPNSQAWVDGFDHTAWLDMTNYFATGYKTGSYPVITEDKLYLWARPHPSNANAPDPVGKPDNFQLDQDVLWAVVFATAPGTVTLHTSDTTSQTFSVTAGVNKLSTNLTPGGYMRGTLARNGQTVIDFTPQGYTFDANPQTYNYNAFTAFAGANSQPTSSVSGNSTTATA
ncbi:glycoside hydrolase family 71 protein [Phlebiopsis gigantea 11061_1 CR5-6]|uniref:Glycoside hydrolase family 71 protein n=1 Tax=Phlebiopsis gigantea (strain 11061_1 CR5-6) TaxID=745531 RepID=A0A0C3S538_PHLG1|nr:glycoside hydrolase family 71 protein [Phlebiopsis gigantea 11061_1 CR5-6]